MIERYKTEVMDVIWSEEAKIKRWAKVELSAALELGISNEDYQAMCSAKLPTKERVEEIEKETNHDVVAFIKAYSEQIGPASKHLHKGLTSSDIVDTATSIAICESLEILQASLVELSSTLKEKAIKYKKLPCIGRTHGIHAEPTSFGLKFLGWYSESIRNIKRLENQLVNMSVGKISGAVGNYSQHDPDFEKSVLRKLNLRPEPVSTQIIPRDRHAEMISSLALIGVMIERMATEIRSLQRTEIGEVEENFKAGQTGSSAMPHKHNPILSERLCGMARMLRGYMVPAFENVALWHERDISHSSNERIIFPDIFHLTHYMLIKAKGLVENLTVFEDKVAENIYKTKGQIFSQNVLTFLLEITDRNTAYKIVQEASKEVNEKYNLYSCVCNKVVEFLPSFPIYNEFLEKLMAVMDCETYLKNIDKIYDAVLEM